MPTIANMSKGQLRMYLRRFLREETVPGSIIGYTKLNNNNQSADGNIDATTSYATISANHKISLVAPDTGNVEINFRGYYAGLGDGTSINPNLYLALSTAESFSSLGNKYEKNAWEADEDDNVIVDLTWFLTGLTPFTQYTYWIGHKAGANGDYKHMYGGSNSGEKPDCIIKAIALPRTLKITTDIS